jgi:dienelactone hydrolase
MLEPTDHPSRREFASNRPDRREFLRTSAAALGATGLALSLPFTPATAQSDVEALPSTQPLEREADFSMEVVDRVDRYFLRKLEASIEERSDHWNRDFSSPEVYANSITENRERFRQIIGAIDERIPFEEPQLTASLSRPALVAETGRFSVHAVRWPVFEEVDGEGLLLEPRKAPVAQAVVLPDADQSPEAMAGLVDNPHGSPLAQQIAAAGMRVLVPTIIDRDVTWSGNELVRMTNQTHREWIYRQSYYMGRHIIGYEVQKVLAAIDWFERTGDSANIGLAGYGEGGLLAFYTAAIDQRITAVLVSGYFREREHLWKEPVYRNVWGLLREFGDAEIASLIAPRSLIVEACRGPKVEGRPPTRNGYMDAAHGEIVSPPLSSVKTEFGRAREIFEQLGLANHLQLRISGDGQGPAGSSAAVQALLDRLTGDSLLVPTEISLLDDRREAVDGKERMKRQVKQLETYTQRLITESSEARGEFWSKNNPDSPLRRSIYHQAVGWQETTSTPIEAWEKMTPYYREYYWKEIVGKMPEASLEPNARTRLIYESDEMKGYEVVMDVWPEVINYGILLIPKDVTEGEKRPVVVTQHGRGGRPQDLANPLTVTDTYHSFGAKLAARGFIVYAPQNLYIGEDKYRLLERKANPLKRTFFAAMVRQHEQVLHWLGSLSFVDPDRIGFYGLSYGGKSAMIIPAILHEGYAVSICSGDFNQAVWKHASTNSIYSFMFTKEYEHTEFGTGVTFNYAEIAGLIAPRPFMVERGHYDIVAPNEWVGYEYGRVRRLYADLRISDRTTIDFFIGPHEIHGEATFDFLHDHLNWRRP